MAHQPTNPEDCFGTSLWGFGPWPFEGTDADLQAWAHLHVLIPGGPISVVVGEPHLDHDAGLQPDPDKYHPTPSQQTVLVDPTMPVTEAEWDGLIALGIIDSAAPFDDGVINPEDLSLAWVNAQLPSGYPAPVGSCPPHPAGAGYGGVGYGIHDNTGTGFGLGSYGARWFPAPPMNVSGGYGGDPYGLAGFGGTEVDPPHLTSAISLTGYQIEVFFSEEMDTNDPALLDPASYTLTPVTGAPSSVTAVAIEKVGPMDILGGDFTAGVTSVVITHTGTTLGGTYQVQAVGMKDVAGNPILGATVSLLTKGEAPIFSMTPQSGSRILAEFSENMLQAADYHPGAVDTILSGTSYSFTSSPDYPIGMTVSTVEHPYQGSAKKALLTVLGQTKLTYTPLIAPATAIKYLATQTPEEFGALKVVGAGNTVIEKVVGSTLLVTLEGVDPLGVGYVFTDPTAKLGGSATFRTDLTFDATGSFIKPTVHFERILQLLVDDGTVELGCWLGWDGTTNQPLLAVTTGLGGFSQSFTQYDWTTGQHTITLIRNQKAGIVTALFDGTPIFSTAMANLVPPTQPVGGNTLVVGLGPDLPKITDLKISSLVTTATSTVFSGAWNFMHDEEGPAFVGDASLTKDKVRVARGPLVKDWGDGTPATKNDVEVLVGGTPVEVADVNPYLGEVQTVIPVPLLPIGMADVSVNYTWMASPTMPFAELNLPGLVLNKYDCTHGHHDPAAHGEQNQVPPGPHFLGDPGFPKGAPDTSRYPMGLVLGPMTRPQPLHIGHRYMGFERGYSSLLNSPTTLLLNQHPNRSIQPGFEQRPVGEAVAFEGLVRPTSADPLWQAVGTDTGGVDFTEEGAAGTYTLKDDNSGSYDPDDPQAAYYWRDVDLTSPSKVYMVGRWFLDLDSISSDGVFTGVGMGIHDGHHLYLAGCLLINGVQHVGILTDATRPGDPASWRYGPKVQLSLASQNTATCLASEVPADLVAGDRFQVNGSHPQDGVYTCTSVVFQTDGTVTLTVEPDFPAHWNTYGNKFPTAFFETPWAATASTYRLEVDPDGRSASLVASGLTTANITTIDETLVPKLPQPAQTSLLLPPPQEVQNGQAFWGSLSREATNQSTWSFFRYGVVPDVTVVAGHEVVVEAEMSEVPERDPNHDWMLLENFGYSEIDSTADALLLKQTSGDPGRNFAFGYARNEPWFIPDSNFDLTAKFRVETGSGVQDAQVVINDTEREIRFSTLLYREGVVADPQWRQLVRTPLVSINGLQDPANQDGWSLLTQPGQDPPSIDVVEGLLRVTQASEQFAAWLGAFTDNGLNFTDQGGRVLEARFRVVAHTAAPAGATSIKVRGEFGSAPVRMATAHLVTGGVRVESDETGTLVQQYAFDWDDDEFHTYRLVLDAENDAVLLYLDDTLQLPTMASSAFTGGSNNTNAVFGQFGNDLTGVMNPAITSTVEWHSVSFQGLPANACKRTLGVLRGSNPDSINDWELPRTDPSPAQNSRQNGPVIEEMDWREDIEVRIWRDPTWGVTVFRPDLPLPPYYQSEDPSTPGTGFATQITEPSAGWINVEYNHLPREEQPLGRVEFGSLRKENVTQQRWQRVRYRLFRSHTDNIRMPENMVLNRHNVITSGELTADVGHETVVVQTLDDRRVTLLPTHLYAESIWKVIDGSNIYTSEMFDFLPEGQLIALKPDDDGNPRCFGLKVQGTKGSFEAKSKVFTADEDITGVVAGDLLKIRFGKAEGSYLIEKVDTAAGKVWVTTAFPASPAGGDEEWSISQAKTPVTVVFVPGKPVTNTYLLNQPLLDGITRLNEGTPPVPKSQMAESERQEIWGSQINDPNDVLNVDPEFILNDPFRVVTFTNDPDSLYEGMEFMEVTEGEEGLLSFPCEATLLSDTPGFMEAGVGDKIYEVGGPGAPHGGAGANANLTETGDYVGAPTGAHLLWFSGTSFWEGAGAMVSTEDSRVVHTVEQGGGMPGKFFFASGGNYVGPVLSGGTITSVDNPLGGTLGPGTTIFYPTYPSLPPRLGGGKIYRQTEWFMRLREVLVDASACGQESQGGSVGAPNPEGSQGGSAGDDAVVGPIGDSQGGSIGDDLVPDPLGDSQGGGGCVGQMLDEEYSLDLADSVPPSEPHLWLVNPNGTPEVLGAAFAVMSGAGDYSRYGPWGGVDALSPKKDFGHLVFVQDPAPVGIEVVIEDPNSIQWVFTGVVIPATDQEWAVAPNGPESLAEVINNHPVVGQYVRASVFTNLLGERVVLVEAVEPVSPTHIIRLSSSDSLDLRVDRVSPTGVLQGGAKVRQSSLLAGGLATVQPVNFHDPFAGMVASGGSPLPQGVEQHLVLTAV